MCMFNLLKMRNGTLVSLSPSWSCECTCADEEGETPSTPCGDSTRVADEVNETPSTPGGDSTRRDVETKLCGFSDMLLLLTHCYAPSQYINLNDWVTVRLLLILWLCPWHGFEQTIGTMYTDMKAVQTRLWCMFQTPNQYSHRQNTIKESNHGIALF